MKSIVLCGGGTAGHVMPNLALLPKLRKNFDKIYYIGSCDGIEKEILKNYKDIEYFAITTVKLIRGLNLKNLLIPFKLTKGYFESKKILNELKPDVIFSKGGYVSVPVTLAGKKLGIPIVAHESDINMGLANKIILKKCNKMCCSFKKTALDIGEKAVFTGTPIRENLFKGKSDIAKTKCGFNNNLPVLLIIGGSLGAKTINNCIFAISNQIVKNFNVIHIVGKGNINNDIKYKNYCQIEFIDNIEDYFALCDMVVSRAGSNAINEFLALNKPMLLIPLPKGNSRGDQILNAQEFLKNGYANVLYQEDMNKNTLIDEINKLKKDSLKIKNAQLRQTCKNGNDNIIKVILDVVKDKK